MKRQERTPGAERPKVGYCRQAYSLPPDVAEAVRRVAYWDRRTCSSVVAQAVKELRERLEKERGEPYATVQAPRMGKPE